MPDDPRGSVTDKRVERRVPASLPIKFDNSGGDHFNSVTRDVSATGLFFETDATFMPGSVIRLMVEMETPAGKRVLKCEGAVVRVEQIENRMGCAVKILDSLLLRPD